MIEILRPVNFLKLSLKNKKIINENISSSLCKHIT